jgi:hypothetical protein
MIAEDKFFEALETAGSFAEKSVKQLLITVLQKSARDLFDDEPTPRDCGKINIKMPDDKILTLCLDLVDSNYRIPIHKFGNSHEQCMTEVLRLFTAAELYFQYIKKTFNLYDECNLVRSRHLSLRIVGTPSSLPHISVVIS